MIIETPYLFLDAEVFIRYTPNNKTSNLLKKIRTNFHQ